MVRFSFCHREMTALPQGALFWPARRALLVADLHLEKASWYARRGQMLPPYDSIATLTELTDLAAATAAEEIWCLGDSFHDREGCDRLPVRAREMLTALTGALRWTWIVGNHDPGFTDPCGGEIVEEADLDGVVLRHQADPSERRPELSGHFHPKLRISHRGRLVSRRCFVASATKLILPAFGALTGGLDATHPEILRAAAGCAEALVPVGDRLLRFPLAAGVRRPAAVVAGQPS
ncbi:MAG: ligase-associated DNA damage response endonuclease PdeM [Allosphingosinicella sp.]